MAAAPDLLNLSAVLDLIERRTGTRPQRATVRAYQRRSQMPTPVAPGQWVQADIEDWIRQRRGRVETSHIQTALAAITDAHDHPEDCTGPVQAARAAGASWTQIGAALNMTKQGAWSRFHTDTDPRPPAAAL